MDILRKINGYVPYDFMGKVIYLVKYWNTYCSEKILEKIHFH